MRAVALVTVALTSATLASAQSAPDQRVAQLHHEYRATTDYVERLIVASKLARAGDYTYWSFVRGEARRAVSHDRPKRRWIRIRPIEPVESKMRYMSIPDRAGRPVVKGEIQVTAHEHQLDIWRILTFSSGAPPLDRELLREAVQSPRPAIAAYAGLGLARLRDLQSAEAIARAGRHAAQADRALFIEALVYLNDEHATKLAAELADDNVEMLQALQVLAKQNRYDPFNQR